MVQFDDYHRTVIGYHGTGLTAALHIVNRVERFNRSQRDYDWLGTGIYFWEYAPDQALNWAEIRQRQYAEKVDKTPEDQRRATEPLAVVACMIRLGYCLDLTEPKNLRLMSDIFKDYKENVEAAGEILPSNDREYRRLDCSVFNYAYAVLEQTEESAKVDSARGVYIPTDGRKRLWRGSWLSRDTHIQLCVRNPSSILGSWLHYPTGLGVNDVCEALQAGAPVIRPTNPQGEISIPQDDKIGTD